MGSSGSKSDSDARYVPGEDSESWSTMANHPDMGSTLSSAAINKSPHAILGVSAGDYILKSVLAEGGFGAVYSAEHATDGTVVAVKVLHAELASRSSVIERFKREVDTIQRIRHPNIVSILSTGCLDNGRPYFVMELLRGVTLHQHLRTRGRLPLNEVFEILEPLCSVLEAAHAHSIVHRDLKPSNVFLADEPEGRRVVLLDFGVAKLLNEPGLTSMGHAVGTLSYMSPEQYEPGTVAVDRRADVYGLGVLTYVMLTGEPPPPVDQGPASYEVWRPPFRRWPMRASPQVKAVVSRAMSRVPEDRHSSVGEFLTEFRKASLPPEHQELSHQKAFAVYMVIEVSTTSDHTQIEESMNKTHETVLQQVEDIRSFALGELKKAGFTVAIEIGNMNLLTMHLPYEEMADQDLRLKQIQHIVSLNSNLLVRRKDSSNIKIHIYLHAGEVLVNDNGLAQGGQLLDPPSWVPETLSEGVMASAAALEGLHIPTRPGDSGTIKFRRIG